MTRRLVVPGGDGMQPGMPIRVEPELQLKIAAMFQVMLQELLPQLEGQARVKLNEALADLRSAVEAMAAELLILRARLQLLDEDPIGGPQVTPGTIFEQEALAAWRDQDAVTFRYIEETHGRGAQDGGMGASDGEGEQGSIEAMPDDV